jgi:hypothetical protein
MLMQAAFKSIVAIKEAEEKELDRITIGHATMD